MGSFVTMVVGEKAVCGATFAARGAQMAVEESATKGAAAYCTPRPVDQALASVTPSILQMAPPDMQSALSVLSTFGLEGIKTFPYYVLPMQGMQVNGTRTADLRVGPTTGSSEYTFTADRSLACLERPLDLPIPPNLLTSTLHDMLMQTWIGGKFIDWFS
jgi:hypothetical protein